jgi:hypothetical protein
MCQADEGVFEIPQLRRTDWNGVSKYAGIRSGFMRTGKNIWLFRPPTHVNVKPKYAVELGYNVVKGTAYFVQKKSITNKCTKSFFINCKYTLLHISTLVGHLQGEIFRCRYTKVALYS